MSKLNGKSKILFELDSLISEMESIEDTLHSIDPEFIPYRYSCPMSYYKLPMYCDIEVFNLVCLKDKILDMISTYRQRI